MEQAVESNLIPDGVKEVVEVFLDAINDWPQPVSNLEDYEASVEEFLGNAVNKSNIEISLSTIDYTKYAWQAESLVQIITIFQYYKNDSTLKDIIEELRIRLINIDL